MCMDNHRYYQNIMHLCDFVFIQFSSFFMCHSQFSYIMDVHGFFDA